MRIDAESDESLLAQVSSKIGVIDSLMSKCDKLVIGGGMVFTFLKARGLNTGSSLVEEDKIDLAKELGEPLSEGSPGSRATSDLPSPRCAWIRGGYGCVILPAQRACGRA